MAERELKAERMATLNTRLATEEGISDPSDPDLPTPGEPTRARSRLPADPAASDRPRHRHVRRHRVSFLHIGVGDGLADHAPMMR